MGVVGRLLTGPEPLLAAGAAWLVFAACCLWIWKEKWDADAECWNMDAEIQYDWQAGHASRLQRAHSAV